MRTLIELTILTLLGLFVLLIIVKSKARYETLKIEHNTLKRECTDFKKKETAREKVKIYLIRNDGLEISDVPKYFNGHLEGESWKNYTTKKNMMEDTDRTDKFIVVRNPSGLVKGYYMPYAEMHADILKIVLESYKLSTGDTEKPLPIGGGRIKNSKLVGSSGSYGAFPKNIGYDGITVEWS